MPEGADPRPLVSVVVPLFEGSQYIEQTLQSILSQTYKPIEVVVVNDGSSDDGPERVASVSRNSQGSIRIIEHQDRRNHGIAASRNIGIRNARGSLIAFIDQDDLWLPTKLEKQVECLLRHPDAAFAYARASFIDREGARTLLRGTHASGGRGLAGEPRNVFKKLMKENSIPTLTILVRKNCLERVGLFDEGPRYEYEDWLLTSKLAFFYEALFIPEVLSMYRLHDRNYSALIARSGLLRAAEEHYTISLFSFVMKQAETSQRNFRKLLRRRIWFFLLRARSWGASAEMIRNHGSTLQAAFPSQHRTINRIVRTVVMVPPKAGSILRRLRRKLVGA